MVGLMLFMLGWRVGVWLSGPKLWDLRKLRPRVELHPSGEGESLGYRAETIRPLRFGDETWIMSSVLSWNGETAVLQVERENSR